MWYGHKWSNELTLVDHLYGNGYRDSKIHSGCEENELILYGWNENDGNGYGNEFISDIELGVDFDFKMTCFDHGKQWVSLLDGSSRSSQNDDFVRLFFHFSSPSSLGFVDRDAGFGFSGVSGDVSYGFNMSFRSNSSSNVSLRVFGRNIPSEILWKGKDLLTKELSAHYSKQINEVMSTEMSKKSEKKSKKLKQSIKFPNIPNEIEKDSNSFLIQVTLKTPFQIKFEMSTTGEPMDQIQARSELDQRSSLFKENIRKKFLKNSESSTREARFVGRCIGDLLGSIGFFHGKGLVPGSDGRPVEPPGKPSMLLTGVPSRSKFPRGFLWDEGFHQCVVARWDPSLSADVLNHWFSLVDSDGWLAREQILGDEARSRVPAEFVVQHPDVANPPGLFLSLHFLLSHSLSSLEEPKSVELLHTLGDLFPVLERHYKWMKRTQAGKFPGSYRWRGRTENFTLASGLDDYPRRRFPSEDEEHLDLLCWIGYMAEVLKEIADIIGQDSTPFRQDHLEIYSLIQNRHWDRVRRLYSDNGMGNERHLGYVNLFPLMFGFLDPSSSRFDKLLKLLEDRTGDGMWSNFGIRSLAKNDPFFGTGENYWRGPIWININYLILRGLYRYYIREGPHHERCLRLYQELRENLIRNVEYEFYRTGFLWEQYNPTTGRGQRNHPFTGWSTLVVLIMGEEF